MPDTLDVVDFETVRVALKVPETPDALVQLATYITGVSRHIDDLCGPVVYRTVTAETHHGGTCSLALRKWPVASITSVSENGTTVDAAGYHLDTESGLLERMSSTYYSWRWYPGRWNVAVTYIAGRYANTAAVDSVFQNAATMAVKGLWTSQQGFGGTSTFGAYAGDLDVNQDSVGGSQYVLPKAAYMLLRGGNYIKSKTAIA